MKIRKKTLLWLAGTAAVASFALASDVVVLHPATISGNVAFSDPLSYFTIYAYPPQGDAASQSYSPAPSSYSMTVEAGDATGLDYRPRIIAQIQGASNTSRYLDIQAQSPTVHVSYPGGNATGVSFAPTTTHLNESVTVSGGTLNTYWLYASCSASGAWYTGFAEEWALSSTQPPSGSIWAAMPACSNVNVSGNAYVIDADGNQTLHALESQTVDLSQGAGSVSWSIDLNNRGQVSGQVVLAGSIPVLNAVVIYQGVWGTDSGGISGNVSVSASTVTSSVYAGSYTAKMPPGDYDVYAQLGTQYGYAQTKPARVTVTAQSTMIHQINETFATVHMPLEVTGFYDNSRLSSASFAFMRQDYAPLTTYSGENVANSAFDFPLTAGSWRPYYLQLSINDNSDPNLPVQTSIYRYHQSGDADRPALNPAAGDSLSVASEKMVLVKSNLYFQVADGVSLVSNPSISAYKYEYNSDNTTLKYLIQVYASGSQPPSLLSGVTMVAEPGTYTLSARATVNGTLTPFGGTSITFGQPAQTSSNSDVVLTSASDPTLKVDVGFGAVSQTGITTMVQSLLGPAPPEGLSVACDAREQTDIGLDCPASYYDIKTTAVWTDVANPAATVCVRWRFPVDVFANAFTDYLHLWHFDESRPVNDQWKQLAAPPPPAGTDCAADPTQYGCSDAFDCMLDVSKCDGCPGPDQFDSDGNLLPQCFNTFKVCGVTSSFSPFTVQFGTRVSNAEIGGSPIGVTGTIRTMHIRHDGTYHIVVNGATGGHATSGTTKAGGCGAKIAGDFTLSAGDTLQVLVGQQGVSTAQAGGGGGGTFVSRNGAPLIVAGGGGGIRSGATVDGLPGSLTTSGNPGSSSADHSTGLIAGGAGGSGGKHLPGFGAGGGGWSGNGEADGTFGEGGYAFTSTTTPGKGGAGKSCGALTDGGFGGGGAGNGCFGGGGGGGYSGGGGGKVAGGGGSYNAGANPTAVAHCTPNGEGSFTITPVVQHR